MAQAPRMYRDMRKIFGHLARFSRGRVCDLPDLVPERDRSHVRHLQAVEHLITRSRLERISLPMLCNTNQE